jgi:hypothetical protein
MTLASGISTVGQSINQAFIIGSGGAVILGYSDDATLLSEGYLADQLVTERLRRTANHVLVSLSGSGSPQDVPANHAYQVSYVVRNDNTSHDIVAADVEFIDLGNFTLTYREA